MMGKKSSRKKNDEKTKKINIKEEWEKYCEDEKGHKTMQPISICWETLPTRKAKETISSFCNAGDFNINFYMYSDQHTI